MSIHHYITLTFSHSHSWHTHPRSHPPGSDLCYPVGTRDSCCLLDPLPCIPRGDQYSETGHLATESMCRFSLFCLHPERPQRSYGDDGHPNWRSGAGLFAFGRWNFKGHKCVWENISVGGTSEDPGEPTERDGEVEEEGWVMVMIVSCWWGSCSFLNVLFFCCDDFIDSVIFFNQIKSWWENRVFCAWS